MKKPSRISYAYAVGRVRSLEKSLVEQAVFKEASEEKDLSSALRVIFDAGNYSDELTQIKDSDELDEYIEKEEAMVSRLMAEILIEKNILDIFLGEDNLGESVTADQRTGSSFIRHYIRHKLDLSNIKILIRAKYLGLPREKFESLIGEGGFLESKFIRQCFELSFTGIGEKLQATPYGKLWKRAIDTLEEHETFLDLERGIEDFLMNFLKKAKYIVFGPEPVFAYGIAKRRELRLLRLLGIGKINRIPDKMLKQRISTTYV